MDSSVENVHVKTLLKGNPQLLLRKLKPTAALTEAQSFKKGAPPAAFSSGFCIQIEVSSLNHREGARLLLAPGAQVRRTQRLVCGVLQQMWNLFLLCVSLTVRGESQIISKHCQELSE